jgi:hypothetical protein
MQLIAHVVNKISMFLFGRNSKIGKANKCKQLQAVS